MEVPNLVYTLSFGDRGQWAGVVTLEYKTESLSDLIDPLYESIGDYELIIYSEWFD